MLKNILKIIFVGMPDMALVCLSELLQKGFNIVGVVPPKKDHETYGYFCSYALANKLNLIEYENSCNEKECIEKIKSLNADIGVVCSFNYLLSREFLSTTKMGYINSHPSKLPQYRGGAPYFHIINNGEKKSAITLHFMDETFDTGDIIYQKDFDILPVETMGTLFNRTNFMIAEGLIDVLGKIENNEELKRISQNKEKEYIKAPRVDGNFRIRWHKSIFEIERLIRATNPFLNAFCFFRGVNLKVLNVSVIQKKHNVEFGKIVLVSDKELFIAAKDGFVSLEVFQVGSWGVFSPKEFNYIFSPKEGEKLT